MEMDFNQLEMDYYESAGKEIESTEVFTEKKVEIIIKQQLQCSSSSVSRARRGIKNIFSSDILVHNSQLLLVLMLQRIVFLPLLFLFSVNTFPN